MLITLMSVQTGMKLDIFQNAQAVHTVRVTEISFLVELFYLMMLYRFV